MPTKIIPAVCLKATAAPVNRLAPHAEHLGFVAYAACETAGLHWLIWFVAAYLAVTGLWVMVARNI